MLSLIDIRIQIREGVFILSKTLENFEMYSMFVLSINAAMIFGQLIQK